MRTDAALQRLERRGVDAIFTSPVRRRDPRFLIGLVSLVSGLALWVAAAIQSRYPYLFGTPEIRIYLFTLFTSIGLILVINGTANCVYFSVLNHGIQKSSQAHRNRFSASDPASVNREESFPEMGETAGQRRHVHLSRNEKFGVIAFFEDCLVLALFSGLADEYQSNNSMELWVRSNFPIGQFLISWWTALIIATVLGLILVQFLPGRPFAE